MVLKCKLRVVKRTIKGLKDDANKHMQEVKMVKNRLSVFEARLSQADTRLWHVERMAYETGFNECRALVVKILPLAKARLL